VTRKTNSEINQNPINENFPIPGQDNDTQVFRDNFFTIKNNLRLAKEELSTVLQGETGAVFKGDATSDFSLNVISNVTFKGERFLKSPTVGENEGNEISFLNGSYNIYKLKQNEVVLFTEFPGDPENVGDPVPTGVGKMTLEIYADPPPEGQSNYTLGFLETGNTKIKKFGFPSSTFSPDPGEDPTFIEVWRHSQETIFIRYIGKFTR
jgi:hypothetical protein